MKNVMRTNRFEVAKTDLNKRSRAYKFNDYKIRKLNTNLVAEISSLFVALIIDLCINL